MAVTGNIFGRRNAVLALALLLAAGIGGVASGAIAPAPAMPTGTTPDIHADYTVYIGGFMFAEGTMSATLNGGGYRLQNKLGSAGLPGRVWDARWTMTSEGRIAEDKLKPSRFVFTATEKNETKKRLIVYDAGGAPKLTFDPPLPPEERNTTQPHERRNTLDPVSAFLLPVIADGNPCDRKIPVFDGKRRYDLHLIFDRNDTVATRNNGYSGEAVRCKVRITPGAGMERGKLTKMMQRRDDTWIWLAPVDGKNVYIPVRVQLKTPIGGAVLDVVKLERHAASQKSAGQAVE